MQPINVAGLAAARWSFCSFTIVLTLGRFYIRWQKQKNFKADDFLTAASLVTLIAFDSLDQALSQFQYDLTLDSLGQASIVPSDAEVRRALKINLAEIVFFWVTQYLVKGAFLALYWTIFRVSRAFRMAWWPVALFTLASFLATFMAAFWQCGNPAILSDPVICGEISGGLIIRIQILWVVLNVISDFLIMVLPFGMLRALKMARAEKIGLAAMFAIVAIDIVLDIVRTLSVVGSVTSTFTTTDPNLQIILTFAEPAIAVIVGALPSYGSLLSRPRRKSSAPYENSEEAQLYRRHYYRNNTELDDLTGHSLRSGADSKSGGIVEVGSTV